MPANTVYLVRFNIMFSHFFHFSKTSSIIRVEDEKDLTGS